MDIYRPLCRHVVIPLWNWYSQNSYLDYMDYLIKSQYANSDEIKKKQWEMMKRMLDHAYGNTAFYRKRFEAAGIDPQEIQTWEDYEKVPILRKQDVREHGGSLYAGAYDKYSRFITSGSTGTPLEGYRNKACQEWKKACVLRCNMWGRYRLGERVYCLYGNPPEKLDWRLRLRRKLYTREEFLDSLSLTEESMMRFADLMKKRPPSLVWGHAHNMYLFASFLEKRGIRDIRPKGMFSAGMVLHPWERKKVEEVFQCEFMDRYGCEEFGIIAAECRAREGLHINTDDLIVEFLNKEGRPVKPGELGHVVVTDLMNYVMPFIRYKMEDVAVPSAHKCSCGRTQPLIEKIEGRLADFILTPDGRMISGISLTDHFGANIPGVGQIQIVQEKIDELTLNIVKDDFFSPETQATIEQLVRRYFGEAMKYRCEFMKNIEQEASGKYRFTVCKVKNPYI